MKTKKVSLEEKRIAKMIQSYKTDGRAFSNLSNDDSKFFEGIQTPYDNLGVTSQTGLDLVYYNPSIYEGDTNALRSKRIA